MVASLVDVSDGDTVDLFGLFLRCGEGRQVDDEERASPFCVTPYFVSFCIGISFYIVVGCFVRPISIIYAIKIMFATLFLKIL